MIAKQQLLTVFFLLSFICPFTTQAVSSNLVSSLYTTEHGLSSTKITCITEDSKGFLWIGTEDGLNKFDGYSFVKYKRNNDDPLSLRSDHITSLLTDSRGRLWVGTINGLQYYDSHRDGFYSVSLGQPSNILKTTQCVSIIEDSQGYLWFASSGNGVVRYSPKSGRSLLYTPSSAHPEDHLCSNEIRCIHEDRRERIWLGSEDKGISIFSLSTKTFHNIAVGENGLTCNQIFDIAMRSNGDVMASTVGGGVNLYKQDTGEFLSFPALFKNQSAMTFTCLENEEKEILVGTEGNGLLLFNPEKATAHIHPAFKEDYPNICDAKIHVIYKDRHNNLWIGLYYKGLMKVHNNATGFRLFNRNVNESNSLSYGPASGMTIDRHHNLWIATDGGGINRYSYETNTYTHFRHDPNDPRSLSDDAVVSIYCDHYGDIWAGTYVGGLCRLNPDGKTFTVYHAGQGDGSLNSNFVRTITEDDEGTLWVGTNGGGINRFDRSTGKFHAYLYDMDPERDYVTKLFFDKSGLLWIGTYFGLSCMNMMTKTFITFGDDSGISSSSVYSIAQTEDGTLWVGTQNGLFRFNQKSQTFEEKLLSVVNRSEVINGIIPVKNDLWISTNQGIIYVNAKGKSKHYGPHSGLQGNEFIMGSYFKSSEGELFFGGVNGVNSFFPADIKEYDERPVVYITDLEISNNSVPIGKPVNGHVILQSSIWTSKKVSLRYNERNFMIRFAAPGASDPSSLFYSCMLEGYDKDWTTYESSQRFVSYTNLDPGTYVFKVRASNDRNHWGKACTSIVIRVMPSPWAAWWAKLIYAIIICAIIYLLLRFIFIRIRDKNDLRIERLKVKQQEEMGRDKMQFFTNISHEFRTPLTLIIGPLEHWLAEDKEHANSQTGNMMLRNARRLLSLINEILELRKLEMGKMKPQVQRFDMVAFVRDTADSFQEMASEKKIALKVDYDPSAITIWYDPDMFDKCLYNILSNAFKYTPENGAIQVKVRHDQTVGTTILSVSDTGCGMDPETSAHIFERFYQGNNSTSVAGTGIGLHLTYNIVKLHKGTITVDSKPGEGTTFTITIPDGNEQFATDEIVSEECLQPSVSHHDLPETEDPVPENDSEATDDSNEESHGTLLIVDDEADMRRFIHDQLKNRWHIVEADNGETAMEKARKLLPDLIITDVMMPGMDGNELCRRLKTDGETSHIPVILITAQSGEENQIKGLSTGADSYITKPFNTRLLKITIEKLIETRRSMREHFSNSLDMGAKEIALTGVDERLLQSVIDFIRDNIENSELTVETMSKALGLSRTHLHRKVKALTGQTPAIFIKVIRMKQAAYLLASGKLSVSEVGYRVGYSSPSYFSISFTQHFGMTPSAYIDKTARENGAKDSAANKRNS